MKKANKPTEEIEDDKALDIPISKKELEALFNGARALNLIAEVEQANSDTSIGAFDVVLELTGDPMWEVIMDLQERFRKALEESVRKEN